MIALSVATNDGKNLSAMSTIADALSGNIATSTIDIVDKTAISAIRPIAIFTLALFFWCSIVCWGKRGPISINCGWSPQCGEIDLSIRSVPFSDLSCVIIEVPFLHHCRNNDILSPPDLCLYVIAVTCG